MVTMVQETRFPEKSIVHLHVQPKNPGRFGLKFRVPQWAHGSVKVKVNNEVFKIETIPGKWATIERKWRPNDKVILQFDLSPRIEPLTGYVSPVAIMCGPVVMVKTTARECNAGIPTEGDLKFPADWLIGRGGRVAYSWSPLMKAPVDRGRRLRSNEVFRPFYEVKAGEFYRMYFERDRRTSISPDKLIFHGEWASEGTMRYAEEPGSYFEGKFKGTTVVWEGLRREDAGIAKVSIDGKEIAEVDQYSYTNVHMRLDQLEVPFRWSKTGLKDEEHTIKVTISPNKNPASLGTKINIQRLIVYR